MKKEEAEDMLVTIEAHYPMFMNGRPEVLKKRVEVWVYRLMEMDYEKAKNKLDEYINSDTYPPTIADIKPYEFEFDSVQAKLDALYNEDETDDN